MGKKTKTPQQTEPSSKLTEHLRSLGIANASAYQAWCAENGFGSGLNKPKKMLARERKHQRSLACEREQARDRGRRLPLRKCLARIASGEQSGCVTGKACVERFSSLAKLHAALCGRGSLVRLVTHLLAVRSKVVDESHCETSIGEGGISMLESLVLVATHRDQWIRPLEDWKPRTRNAVRQFRSLLRHLFDRYGEVPIFMDQAWSVACNAGGSIDSQAATQRRWYLQIGSGQGVKSIEFPISMTKRMRQHFLQAPVNVSIAQAVRWGQVKGLGGDDRLADAILGSRIGEAFCEDEFWTSVIRWLIGQPMLNPVHVGPITDYLHHQRFVPQRAFGAVEPLGPAEPNLTMRGRTATSVLRQVENWHQRLSRTDRVPIQTWSSCGIDGFEFAEGKESSENFRVWTIRELRDTKSLVTEGRKLKHCVATYARSCTTGATSIWTLELETYSGTEKRITIEVVPRTRTIVQARGKFNRQMNEQESSMVRRWSAVAGLTLARSVA